MERNKLLLCAMRKNLTIILLSEGNAARVDVLYAFLDMIHSTNRILENANRETDGKQAASGCQWWWWGAF